MVPSRSRGRRLIALFVAAAFPFQDENIYEISYDTALAFCRGSDISSEALIYSPVG